MKALIAVDGSAGSFEAVRQTVSLLQPGRDQVVFYYSPPGIKPKTGSAPPEVLQKAQFLLSDVVFEEAKQLLPEGLAVGYEKILGHESPQQGIVAAAVSCKANLIALGARGLGPIERLLLGSVSTAVVHSAQVPVLVARPRPSDRAQQPFKVLVGCGSADEDGFLAETLKAFHWPSDTEGLTISVVQSMFAGQVPKWLEERARSEEVETMAHAWVTEHEAEIEAKKLEISRFDANLPEPFRAAAPIVVEGHPAEKILAAIKEHKIDLAVIGARTRSSVTRRLLGSTPQTVLNHASCSVLVIRSSKTS